MSFFLHWNVRPATCMLSERNSKCLVSIVCTIRPQRPHDSAPTTA